MIKNQDNLQITYYLSVADQEKLISVMDELKQKYPGCSVILVDHENMLGG